jgi:hypothetical protein
MQLHGQRCDGVERREQRAEPIQLLRSVAESPFVPCDLHFHEQSPGLAEPVAKAGSLAEVAAALPRLSRGAADQGQLEVRLGERGINRHRPTQERGGFVEAEVVERVHALRVQPVRFQRCRRHLGNRSRPITLAQTHAVADPPGQLVDEREEVCSTDTRRREHASTRQVLHLRVYAKCRPCAQDAAHDRGTCASTARDLRRLHAIERLEGSATRLSRDLMQSLRADDVEAARLGEAGQQHALHTLGQPGGVGVATQRLECHHGNRWPTGGGDGRHSTGGPPLAPPDDHGSSEDEQRPSDRGGHPWRPGARTTGGSVEAVRRADRSQGSLEFVRGLVSAARIFLETTLDDRPERSRHGRGKRRGRVVQDGRAQLERGRAGERAGAACHLMEQHAERPDVAAHGWRLATEQFRRHVRRGAGQQSVPGDRVTRRGQLARSRGIEEPREAEVEELGATIGRDHDVRTLEVAVHDALPVGMRERTRDLGRVTDDVVDRKPCPRNQRGERLPLDILHRDVEPAVEAADLVDGADVRMVQSRCMLGLAPKARIGILREPHLQCDGASEIDIACDIHLAHPARADPLAHLIAADASSRERRRRMLDERGSIRVGAQEALDLRTQTVVSSARGGQICVAIVGVTFQRIVEELLDALPPLAGRLVVHGVRGRSSA